MAIKKQIIYKKLNEIHPYKNNPRFNDGAVQYVKKSIQQFHFQNPIIISTEGEIICGHTRYKASLELGLKEVPCIVADDLTDEQVKAFRLADNKVSEKSQWNFELLDEELNNILDINMEDFGFNLDDIADINIESNGALTDEKYTTKVDIPQYEITGEEPEINELYNMSKSNELIEKINKSSVTDEQKKFLIEASKRHTIFNYAKIAEYYAHQNKEMQQLMEDSALVIIDFDDAIKNGYVELRDEILSLEEEEDEEE